MYYSQKPFLFCGTNGLGLDVAMANEIMQFYPGHGVLWDLMMNYGHLIEGYSVVHALSRQ